MTQECKSVKINEIEISNNLPFTVFGGMNVLEDEVTCMEIAKTLKETCSKLALSFVFKASFDKANRSSVGSYRGLDYQGWNTESDYRTKYTNHHRRP